MRLKKSVVRNEKKRKEIEVVINHQLVNAIEKNRKKTFLGERPNTAILPLGIQLQSIKLAPSPDKHVAQNDHNKIASNNRRVVRQS